MYWGPGCITDKWKKDQENLKLTFHTENLSELEFPHSEEEGKVKGGDEEEEEEEYEEYEEYTEYSNSTLRDTDIADDDTDISEPEEYASLSPPPYHYLQASLQQHHLMNTSFLWLESGDEQESEGHIPTRTFYSKKQSPRAVVYEEEMATTWYSPFVSSSSEYSDQELEEREDEAFEYSTATPVSPTRARVIDIPRRSSNASSISSLALEEVTHVQPPCVKIIAPTPKISTADGVDAWVDACAQFRFP